jgi:hypothetical protein
MEPGTKVLVEFNTAHWPIHKATYTYEGHDDEGWWFRRKDGVQRRFSREDVVSVTAVEEDVPEPEF